MNWTQGVPTNDGIYVIAWYPDPIPPHLTVDECRAHYEIVRVWTPTTGKNRELRVADKYVNVEYTGSTGKRLTTWLEQQRPTWYSNSEMVVWHLKIELPI